MLGGMIAFFLMQFAGPNYFVSLVASIVLVMCIGYFVERILLKRLRDKKTDILVAGALVTIGVSIFLQNMGLLVFGSVPRLIASPFSAEPFKIGPILLGRMNLFAALVTVGVILFSHFFIKKTTMGMAMRATFQDKDVAALVGVHIDRVFSFTFMLGAGLAATAGGLLGPIYIIYPNVGESVILKAFVIVVLGGMGNFLGSYFCGPHPGRGRESRGGLCLGGISRPHRFRDGFADIALQTFRALWEGQPGMKKNASIILYGIVFWCSWPCLWS